MTETSVVTHLGKSRSPKPDLSIIFNKIEAIEREIRELRRVPALSRNQTRLDEARLSPVQEEALRTL